MARAEFDATFGRVRDAGIAYGDSFHAVGNMQGPGDEDGARGPGKAVYLKDPSEHLVEIRYYPEERLALRVRADEVFDACLRAPAHLARRPGHAVRTVRVHRELGLVAGELPSRGHEHAVVEQRVAGADREQRRAQTAKVGEER